jgi:hypothetical protein
MRYRNDPDPQKLRAVRAMRDPDPEDLLAVFAEMRDSWLDSCGVTKVWSILSRCV